MSTTDLMHLLEELQKQNVDLVAVSKTKSVQQIRDVYELGVRDFGENRVQELVEKLPQLPGDIRWHMIGNLQRNKVKYIAPFVYLIHSVSSHALLKTIDKEAGKNYRVIRVLLQVKIASEDSKSGLPLPELKEILETYTQNSYGHVDIRGFMGMGTFTDDETIIRQEFQHFMSICKQTSEQYPDLFSDQPILSIGMSGDYKIAIEEGSNMVRIGSLIFGPRI